MGKAVMEVFVVVACSVVRYVVPTSVVVAAAAVVSVSQ